MESRNEQNEREGGGRAAFRKLSLKGRLQFIWDYEKLPLLGILILVIVVGNMVIRQITKKEVVVSAAVVNIKIGEDTTRILTDDFAAGFPGGTKKNTVQFDADLILTDNSMENADDSASSETVDGATYEYAYASGMKLLALMTNKSLDVVIMDSVAYDQFSRNDYLLSLKGVPSLASCQSLLTPKGDAFHMNKSSLYKNAGFNGDIYIAIIADTEREENAIQYVNACMA